MRSIVILLSCAWVVLATQKSYEGYKVYSLTVDTEEKFAALNSWEETELDFWEHPNRVDKPARVMVPPGFIIQFEEFLATQNIASEIIIPNVESTLIEERRTIALNRARAHLGRISGATRADFTYFWRYSEINAYITQLASDYPNVATLINVGSSYEGRAILGLKISLNGFAAGTPVIFVDAGIHAREWIAPMVAVYLINQLVENTANNMDMLQNVNWIILPSINPDGYEYSHTNERFWRKTRNVNEGSTCRGVDANRNFAYQWDAFTGISRNPCDITFNGATAASEPETKVVAAAMAQYRNDIKLYLTLHSYGNYLLFGYGYAAIYHPNRQNLEALGAQFKTALSGAGVTYTVGNSAIVLYLTSGNSVDYAAGALNVDLAYTIELSGGGTQGFDIPANRIQSEAAGVFRGFQVFANHFTSL